MNKAPMLMIVRFATVVVLATMSQSCSEKRKGYVDDPIDFFESCQKHQFDIDSLPYEELPRTGFVDVPLIDTTRAHDSLGVYLFEFEGGQHYHPVALAHRVHRLVDTYHRKGDSNYLDMACNYTDRLQRLAVIVDSAMYFPYHFSTLIHGCQEGPLVAPWFSGMAQGEILGNYSRLFVATGDSAWLQTAGMIFNSLMRQRGEGEPWVTFTDDRGCFWIEEYPVDEPTMTLNGFIYAMYGLYDYYQLTKDERAEEMLQACLSTVKNYIPLFRRPGHSSFYDLRFRYWDAGYHFVHIRQLRHLHRITGDDFFAAWADSLDSDLKKAK